MPRMISDNVAGSGTRPKAALVLTATGPSVIAKLPLQRPAEWTSLTCPKTGSGLQPKRYALGGSTRSENGHQLNELNPAALHSATDRPFQVIAYGCTLSEPSAAYCPALTLPSVPPAELAVTEKSIIVYLPGTGIVPSVTNVPRSPAKD